MNRIRSFVTIMVLAATIIASIASYLSNDNKASYLSEIKMDLNENNVEYSDFIESEISDMSVLLESHSKVFSNNNLMSSSKLADVFKLVNQKKGSISSTYFIYESNGSGVNSKGYIDVIDIGVDLRQRPWYINAVNSTGAVISDVYSDIRKDKLVFTVSCAVRNGNQLEGVLAIDVFLDTLYDKLQGITTWRNTYNYVLDSQGTVVLHPTKELLGLSLPNVNDQQFKDLGMTKKKFNNIYMKLWSDFFSKSDQGYIEYTNTENMKLLAVFKNIPTLQWTVVSAYDLDAVANGILGYTISVTFLSLLLILVFGVFLYYFLVWSDLRDPVTRTINTKMMKGMIRKRQNKEGACILLFIDLRNLSSINNKYGIRGGDEVLIKYSKILQSLVKKHGALVTTKKKNFMIVFDNDDWNNAVEFTNNLDKELNNLPLVLKDTKLQLNTFLGLTSLNFNGKSEFEQEVEFAENLFTELKKSGSDSPLIQNDFHKLAKQRHVETKLKNDLLKAIEEDRIVPFFQPIYNMRSGTVDKFEVLMRIQEGDRFLSPYPYIVIAEKYNIINTVDLIVILKALKYKKSNDDKDEVELSVNISGKSLRDGKFIEKVIEKVDELCIRHSNITFEITETYSIDEMDKVIELVKQYRKIGFKFSIDDFGSGFSSMYYIKHIPANYLKIDGSFIKDIDTNKESYHIVESIISMAKAFNIKIVAEFVERKEIKEMLMKMDVDFGQGYYFGKPEDYFDYHR